MTGGNTYISNDDVEREAGKWLRVALFSFFIPLLASLFSFAIYGFVIRPAPVHIYQSQSGVIIPLESTRETSLHEGEVKNWVAHALKSIFTFNYAEFRVNEDYEKLLAGTLESSLPDYRDRVAPYFTQDARVSFIKKIQESPFYVDLHSENRRTVVSSMNPPIQSGDIGVYESVGGRLSKSYSGNLYLWSGGDRQREIRYLIKYDAHAVRMNIKERGWPETKPYFESVVLEEPNLEWVIDKVDFTVERVK